MKHLKTALTVALLLFTILGHSQTTKIVIDDKVVECTTRTFTSDKGSFTHYYHNNRLVAQNMWGEWYFYNLTKKKAFKPTLAGNK